MIKRILFLTLIALVILPLTGCNTTVSAEQKSPLKIGWSLWPGYYPLILAEKQGYFKERGLAVDARLYRNPTDIPADFTAGKLDGALVTAFDALPINARSANNISPIVMISDYTTTRDAIVATSAISSPADLKGKTIGVALDSYAEVLLRAMLEQAGLSVNDVTLVDVPAEKIPAELGVTIDAGHTYDPYVAQAVGKGHHVIFTGAQTPGLLASVLVARQSVLKDRPEDVRAFVDAFFEAQAWWRQHQIEGSNIIAEATGQRPEDIKLDGLRLYDQADNLDAFGDVLAPKSLYNSLDKDMKYLLGSGTLNSQPNLNQLIDPSYLQKALP
jgi:NitT/TauT family transport system substrate-binding protein